ncbi:MAG: GNAT family N-acetyltransferase [Candidatus Saccharimonadales bacterium]
MNQIAIQKATSQDAEAIAHVQSVTWLATYSNANLGITEADIRKRLEGGHGERTAGRIEKWRKSIEHGDVYVARLGGKMVGFTSPLVSSDGQHRIGALYVLPKAQGKGVGSQLIQKNLQWHGSSPVYLTVAAYNQNTINFYKKFGFKETGKQVEDLPAREKGDKELPEIEMMRPHVNGLVLLIGPPGAGKSTFAQQLIERQNLDKAAHISNDAIAKELFGVTFDRGDHDGAIFAEQDRRVAKRLAEGKVAIVDATNVKPIARKRLIAIADKYDQTVTAFCFRREETTLLRRNKMREVRVPESMVREYAAVMRGVTNEQLRDEGISATFEV